MTAGNPSGSMECGDLLASVADSLAAEVAVVNKLGCIVAVNEAWRQFSAANEGSPETAGVGSNYFDVCRCSASLGSRMAEQAWIGMQQVLNGECNDYQLEYPCHSPHEQRWFLLYVTRLKGRDDCVVTTHLSITDRKLTEQRLIVAERLAAIGEAMRGLSHEGRNALQRAQASLDVLRLHVADDAEALQQLDRIEKGQNYLLGMYDEVSRYAAPIALQRQACRLDQLVEATWASLVSPNLRQQLSHQADMPDLTCDVDPDAIGQVLRVVFQNALATATDAPEFEVAYAHGELNGLPAMTVIISDNGPGIPRADWQKVFQPFYTTKMRGTGLGLSLSERIILAHDGRIGFGAPRLSGASVYITLPLCQR